MADLLGASIPERGAASTLQELLLRSQPLPRSPLRQYSSSSCSEAAAMAAADSLLTPLESCKNVVRSSWHQVVRRRQASSGQPGHHGLWCGQPPSGAASAASRRPLPRGKRNVWGPEDVTRTEQEIAGSPLRQTDIHVRGSVSVVGVRPIHDPVTDTPRAPRRARAATRTLGPLSCADALSLHRRFAISTSCALAAADVRLEQEAHRARY